MDLHPLLHAMIPNVKEEDILYCEKISHLQVNRQYQLIVLSELVEKTPVFEMDEVWEKVKNALCFGGVIVINTHLYENPNVLDKDELEMTDARCNKQTEGTLLRECLKQNFIFAFSAEDICAFVRSGELSFYNEEKQKSFLNHHNEWLSKYGIEKKEHYDEGEIRQLVSGGGRVMIGCVAENNKKYKTQALRLVQSIRWFGGKIAGANIFVCIVDEADPEFVEELNKWNVFVRIVKRFSVVHPPSNKLRLFELPETASYDTVMLLDCDTVMVQDPYPLIDGENFQADIAAGATVPHPIFKKLFDHYQLPLPQQRYITSVSRQRTIWYCNAGVLIFPYHLLKTFYPVWKEYTVDLSQKPKLLGKHHFFCEQASLSIAFAVSPVPFKRLPVQMNYHLTPYKVYENYTCDPVIIHYHHMNDNNGYLKIIFQNPLMARRVKLFNLRLQNYLLKN